MEGGGVKITGTAAGVLLAGGFLAAFLIMAWRGDEGALIALAIIATIVLIAFGAGMVAVVMWLSSSIEQRKFVANAKENMAIMLSMQRVQNLQTQNTMRQIGAGQPGAGGLGELDALMFDSLEEPALLDDGRR